MKIVPTGAALGADIWDVRLDALDDKTFQDIYQAWLEYNGVLRFPCQNLDDDKFLDFARPASRPMPMPIASTRAAASAFTT